MDNKSDLILSSSESFQSISNTHIECCICLDEKNNKECFMPDCKHSWCKSCNEKMNFNNINKCPICKKEFNSILSKGRWVFKRQFLGGYWIWEKGENDSKNKLRLRKIQQFISNIFIGFSFVGTNSIGVNV